MSEECRQGLAAMDISAIASAMSSLKMAGDLTHALIGLAQGKAIQGKVIDLQRHMLEVQQAMFAVNQERSTLIERVGQLEKEVTAAKEWVRERERYELTEFSPGMFAYRLKATEAGSEPQHQLCACCYQAGKKSILQGPTLQTYAGYELKRCNTCSAELKYWRRDLPKAPPPSYQMPR